MRRLPINRVALLISAVLTGVLLFGGVLVAGRNDTNTIGVPAEIPRFVLPDLRSSKLIRLADYAGQPLVINVFDYTCVPCVRELPMLSQVASDTPQVAFVGIHLMLDREKARQFITDLGVSFPVAYDENGVSAPSAVGLPTTVFIDASGAEVDRVTGAISERDLLDRLQRLAPGIS
jgi:thiol-disulfide isomerase/thioredoxin